MVPAKCLVTSENRPFEATVHLSGKRVLRHVGSSEWARPRSAVELQNCHFRNGAAGSDASPNGPYKDLVILVFARRENMMSGELSFVRRARLGRVDSPYREQRLATTWE